MAHLVAGALLSASFQVLFERLSSPQLLNFFKSISHHNEGDKLRKKLKPKLLRLSVVLNDAEKQQFTNRLVKDWMDELKDAIYHADDLLDEIATKALGCKEEAEFRSAAKNQKIGGQEIKANITEKPLQTMDLPFFQSEESEFIDRPHKVYVGNLAKTVTTEMLKNFFAEKGKVLSAKVFRVPGTSKSSGFGFVTFSSEEDVEAVISYVNNALLEGQKIHVDKA